MMIYSTAGHREQNETMQILCLVDGKEKIEEVDVTCWVQCNSVL